VVAVLETSCYLALQRTIELAEPNGAKLRDLGIGVQIPEPSIIK
jgi:hypothetical protein